MALNFSGKPLGEERSFAASAALWERACRVIPGGTNTISKRVTAFAEPTSFPAFIARGDHGYVYDTEDNQYLDFIAALAPIVLGYRHPEIDAAIEEQLRRGILFSLPGPEEVELSEALVRLIPCAERVRLHKTGAEANSAAIRAARLTTGRDRILACGYHGWHDWWAVTKTPAGIPASNRDLIVTAPFGDTTRVEELAYAQPSSLACIIVTPALYGRHPPAGFLERLRAIADDVGCVLVFDEIITGFRWALAGAQGRYGVTPDLATFGKAMANGMPIAALAGLAQIMDPLADNWVSSTYASESLSIAASLATVRILETSTSLEILQQRADALRAGIKAIGERLGVEARTFDDTPVVVFSLNAGTGSAAYHGDILRHCARRGLLIRKDEAGLSLCPTAAHTKADMDATLGILEYAARAALDR